MAERFDQLLGRYLDPAMEWTPAHDEALRAATRESDEHAAAYDRAVVMHRLMVGADPELPSGLEQQRMMATLFAGLPDSVPATSALEPQPNLLKRLERWLVPVMLGCAAVAAVVLVSRGGVPTGAAEEEYLGMRGDAFSLTVGLGVSGVTEQGAEYEVVHSAGRGMAGVIYFDDYLRLTTTRVIDTHPYGFFVGLQPDREPVWYAPDPAHDGCCSVPIAVGSAQVLGGAVDPVEFRLSGGRHALGPLTLVAIFSDRPVDRGEVAALLEGAEGADGLEASLRELTDIGGTAIIRIVELRVAPGSKARTDR